MPFLASLSPARLRLPILAALLLLSAPAAANFGGSSSESSSKPAAQSDFEAGSKAFEAKDWKGVVTSMGKVVAKEPDNAEAHTALGYAYRKLGSYEVALEHYRLALAKDPGNRDALEYMGEAYLEVGQPALSKDLLDRLEKVCREAAGQPSGDGWQAGCEEWSDLKQAYDRFQARQASLQQ